jgi:hypothetical protein
MKSNGTCSMHRNRKLIAWHLALCVGVLSWTGCNGKQRGVSRGSTQLTSDPKRVLFWLPPDTETLLLANGPFWMPDFQTAQDYSDHKMQAPDVQKAFQQLTLSLFALKNGVLEKRLQGKKILLVVEGSRHFCPPKGLGELPYEGCAIAIFADDLGNLGETFMKDATECALKMDEIEGLKVAVFHEQMEEDTWTTFVAFPGKNVVLVATNRAYLQEMLSRMRVPGAKRAFPETLPEWKYVNAQAEFWGMRHKGQSTLDPTSPFGGQKSANVPDDQAIGLTFQCDTTKEKKATITYLSDDRKSIRKTGENRLPSSSEREATAGLHIRYDKLKPGAIQSTYDLSGSQPLDWFLFVFMADIRHAVYV